MAAEQRRRAVSRAVSEQIRAPIALARGTPELLAAVGAAAEARDAAADASTTLATALGRADDLLSIEAPDGAVGSGAAFRRLEVDELATEALRAPSAEGARAGVAVPWSPRVMRLDPRALEDAARGFRSEVLAVLPRELAEIELTLAARDPDAADLLLHRIVRNAHTAGARGRRDGGSAGPRGAWAAAAEHVGELRQAVATAHDGDLGRGAP